MNIAMTILKIRKDKKMTQEDFSKLFNVTRQTVSNWENEKSYPDLQTLIKISDMFEISLDTLMKGDKTMVKKFDKELLQSKLIKNILKVSSIALTVLVVAYGIYTAIWYNNKKVFEENFFSTIRELGYEYDAGLYLSNSYGVDSEGNIVSGNLSKRDKVTYDELKDKIALMAKKSYELYEEIYGQYE